MSWPTATQVGPVGQEAPARTVPEWPAKLTLEASPKLTAPAATCGGPVGDVIPPCSAAVTTVSVLAASAATTPAGRPVAAES